MGMVRDDSGWGGVGVVLNEGTFCFFSMCLFEFLNIKTWAGGVECLHSLCEGPGSILSIN